MNVLITGGSGFLGQVLIRSWLEMPEVKVTSMSRTVLPDTFGPHLKQISTDLSEPLQVPMNVKADLVIHNAGKAHSVPRTEAEAALFHSVNSGGTANFLAWLSGTGNIPSYFVLISTVAVYGLETGTGIGEETPCHPTTPYAVSKREAEKQVLAWCRQHHVSCTILRLPLVIGSGAPGNLGAIGKAIRSGRYFSIKNNPSRKSMILATDVAAATKMYRILEGIYNIADDSTPGFTEVEAAIARRLNRSLPVLPFWIIRMAGWAGSMAGKLGIPLPVNRELVAKMTSTLTFSTDKIKATGQWKPESCIRFLSSGYDI